MLTFFNRLSLIKFDPSRTSRGTLSQREINILSFNLVNREKNLVLGYLFCTFFNGSTDFLINYFVLDQSLSREIVFS